MELDKKYVLSVYPNAGAIMLNKGMFFIGSEGRDGSKMSRGETLSGQFRTESQAWEHSAKLLREGKRE